MPPTFLTFI